MDWSVILALLLVVSVCAEDRWIWAGSHNMQDNNVRTPKILGRVNSQQRSNALIPKIRRRANENQHLLHRPSHSSAPNQFISLNARISINSFPPFFPFMPFAGFMGLQGLPVKLPQTVQQKNQQAAQQALRAGFMGLQGLPVVQPQPVQQKFQRATHQALLARPLPVIQPQPVQQKFQRAAQQTPLARPPNHALPLPGDGTTKSRVTEDTPFNIKSVVEDGGKYTTIDKHQSQFKETQPLPRPSEELLGGLDPEEVFYADEDLLIIKGGGFNSDKFEEPSQTLDDSDPEDPELGHGTRDSPLVLPNPDLEYNGNIPAILPPPSSNHGIIGQTDDQSHFAVFMESPSRINTMTIYIPYEYSLYNSRQSYNSLDFRSQLIETEPNSYSLYAKQSTMELPVLQSLSGDTAVNYLDPRPFVNQYAELIGNDYQQIELANQPILRHRTPQVVYHQPHSVYQYPPAYPYQEVYNQPKTVEFYRRPANFYSRPKPNL